VKKIDKIVYFQMRARVGSLILLVLLSLIIVALSLISPWSFQILIDKVLSTGPIHSAGFFGDHFFLFKSREMLGAFAVVVYFLSMFLLSIVEYVNSVSIKVYIKKLTSDFSKNAFKNVESLAIGYYNKQQIGDYIYKLSYDVSALGEFVESGILPLITSFFYLIVTVTVMFFINATMTFLTLLSLPVLIGGLFYFNKQITYVTKRSEFYNSIAFSFIEEVLSHLKVVQAFSRESSESSRFNKKIDMSLEADTTYYKLDYLLTLFVGIIIAIAYSIIMIYGIHAVFNGTLTTGLLIVFIFYLDNLTSPIISMVYAVAEIKKSYVKISRMEEFFSEKRKTSHAGTVSSVAVGKISFHNVSFLLGKVKVLDNISFDIEAGKRTVIFGMNGSGKSSVANILLRFNEPTSGKIFIDGINILEYDLLALRESISYIPQEIALFNESIYNNIAFGSHNPTEKDVHRAAALATANEFINRNPKKYAFKVGESGNFLSGGQRQRIMIARALMKDQAKILVFDETFSALDVKTRESVLHNLSNFSEDKTTVIISNIFSVVSTADNVIVLHKGKVIYSGTPKRLVSEISLYKMILEHN
jgi:ABC-type bacteriocin/lantibiotic exporter with double-glycine peptidase domain